MVPEKIIAINAIIAAVIDDGKITAVLNFCFALVINLDGYGRG